MKELNQEEQFNRLKKCFFYTFMLGFVAHGYRFLNLTLSHDSLNDFYAVMQWQKSSMGRIFYSIYISITRGRLVLPWLIGILALCWTSLAVYLIVRMFSVEKSSMIFLVSGICITNPTVYALAATYIHDLDADLFALLMAVVSVFLWKIAIEMESIKNRWIYLALAALILSVTLGTYQSYISVTIALIMFICIKNLLEQKQYITVLYQGLSGIAMIFISGVIYFFELKIFTGLTGVSTLESQKYNGLSNMSQLFEGNLLFKIADVYRSFINAFKSMILSSAPECLTLLVQGILVLGIIAMSILAMKKMEWKRIALFVILGVLLPFGMNITCLLSNGVAHVLTQYAIWFVYLFAIVLVLWLAEQERISEKIKKVFQMIILVCICMTIWENIQTANAIYVKKDLEYQTTFSYMTRVAERMEIQENYIPGETPVVLVGEGNIGNSKYGFERYHIITGVEGNSPLTYYDTFEDYFEYILGISVNLIHDGTIREKQEVKSMPAFPKEGSVIMVDETLVVKLSD